MLILREDKYLVTSCVRKDERGICITKERIAYCTLPLFSYHVLNSARPEAVIVGGVVGS